MSESWATDSAKNTEGTDPPRWPALEAQPFPCLLVDRRSGRVVYGNEMARRLGLAELADRLVADAAGPDRAEVVWDSPGGRAVFRAFCRPVPNDPGLAALTFVDLTRQKHAEEELRQALEARDEFFSVATHELKDPLFSLQLSIQLLRRTAVKQGEIPPHVLQHLEVSERQADRLARLIENLLDVTRIMNRRVQLDVEAVDLGELAREAAARCRDRAQAAGTSVEVEPGPPLVVYADRLKLEQVVGNLLSNAIKYGAGKPVTLRVRAAGESAVLEVEDRGPGIAPADQQRVFNRFERASPGHRRDSLGLGLYIVRSFVEAHGGSVALRSEPGRGATFTVTLPRGRLRGRGDTGQQPSGG